MACRRSESLAVGDVGEVVGLWHLSWAIDQAVFFKKGERERQRERETETERETDRQSSNCGDDDPNRPD